jgi:flagellar basal-body rod protein FlgC
MGLDISASALTASRLRMDIIAANIANAETTRGRFVDGAWQPYTRKLVVLEPQQFSDVLKQAGVKATRIVDDPTPYKSMYMPEHPDADASGMVRMPNVDMLKEMADMMQVIRSYEANVTALNASKAMISSSLDIGRA